MGDSLALCWGGVDGGLLVYGCVRIVKVAHYGGRLVIVLVFVVLV